MSLVRSAACAMATLLLLAGATVASSEDDPGEEQCLNVAVDHLATEFNVFVTLFGAIGVGVASPQPGKGLAFHVYVVPELCDIGVAPFTTLTSMLSENPIYESDDDFPLLP